MKKAIFLSLVFVVLHFSYAFGLEVHNYDSDNKYESKTVPDFNLVVDNIAMIEKDVKVYDMIDQGNNTFEILSGSDFRYYLQKTFRDHWILKIIVSEYERGFKFESTTIWYLIKK